MQYAEAFPFCLRDKSNRQVSYLSSRKPGLPIIHQGETSSFLSRWQLAAIKSTIASGLVVSQRISAAESTRPPGRLPVVRY
jgi:hypothetical protein